MKDLNSVIWTPGIGLDYTVDQDAFQDDCCCFIINGLAIAAIMKNAFTVLLFQARYMYGKLLRHL